MEIRFPEVAKGRDAVFMRKRGQFDDYLGKLGLFIEYPEGKVEQIEFLVIALLQEKGIESTELILPGHSRRLLLLEEKAHETRDGLHQRLKKNRAVDAIDNRIRLVALELLKQPRPIDG